MTLKLANLLHKSLLQVGRAHVKLGSVFHDNTMVPDAQGYLVPTYPRRDKTERDRLYESFVPLSDPAAQNICNRIAVITELLWGDSTRFVTKADLEAVEAHIRSRP